MRGRVRRGSFNPPSRSGEAAKKSASVPTRLVFRCHSSASTITTAVRPFRVTVCGPSDMALSITSLNFALAWATLQVFELIAFEFRVCKFMLKSSLMVIIVIMVIKAKSRTTKSAKVHEGLRNEDFREPSFNFVSFVALNLGLHSSKLCPPGRATAKGSILTCGWRLNRLSFMQPG
jgi:hypothetical protein